MSSPLLTLRWFARDAPEVAVDLLGKLLVVDAVDGRVSGRISETEAYTADDPASHSFNGPTKRNEPMFGPAGHLYVYLSYGIHCCANIVTGEVGDGQAVLIRAIEPVDGIDAMRERRPGRPDRQLANGPGKLCVALGIDLSMNGLDLTDVRSSIRIIDDGIRPPSEPIVGPRVGISKALDRPWRYRTPER
jgi:DNA-3-methyladenine glycosylase